MNQAQLQPRVKQLKHEMVTAKKKSSETMTEYVNRVYHIKTQLVECGEVYQNDLDVINWIVCGLDAKLYTGVHNLVATKERADTDITILMPLLTNLEAAMEISKQRFGQPSAEKVKYGVFSGKSQQVGSRGRGRSRSSSRGRSPSRDDPKQREGGKSPYRGSSSGSRGRRCWECNSPDHLINACPYKKGYNNMSVKTSNEPATKRVRFNTQPPPPPPRASEKKHVD